MIPTKPKDVFWSDMQWQAIHDCGKNILVSAGAGSGKTAVLTQRIIEILKRGISLDRLIVLTFTKAAASEMKERVRKELEKEVKVNYSLKESLDYLDQANIQTFDSFSLELVKKYHYLLNVSKDINIGDKVILDLKRKEIIEEVFNELYETKDKDFLDFINVFTIKNDDLIREYIFKICLGLDLLIDKDSYLDHYLDNYYNEELLNKRVKEYLEIIKLYITRIKFHLKKLEDNITDEALINYLEKLKDALTDLLASRTLRGFKENIEIKLPNIPRTSNEVEKEFLKEEKNWISDLIKELKEYAIYDSEEEIINEIKETKKYAEVIIKIIKEVERRFFNYKLSINLFDFLDVAKLAIKLFSENSELKDYYKNHIYEILIDEYQDTNDIQEALINLIANNNVYMVGDIKQSIYRFRNANPDIFKDKYNLFKVNGKDLVIDLVENFRSRKEVLEDINIMFSKLMSIEIGGVDYNDNHSLKFGNLIYEKLKAIQNYNLEILNYEVDNDDFKDAEIEAFIVAKDIKEKIESKYQVFDKEKKCLRDCTYQDFTILSSGKKNFEIYKKIFEYFSLPLVIHKEEDFVRSNEIYVIKNILRIIYSLINDDYYKDNFKDAIVSLLRSFLVEASDEDISLLFLEDIKEGLNLRFHEIYTNLINISRTVQNLTLSEILGEIYKNFDIYYKLVRLGDVEEKENKLNYFLTKFSEFDKLNYTLLDAITYLEAVMNSSELDIQSINKPNISKEAINMMSIHMSKGLEFPICYYVDLSTKFVYKELNDRILFDKEYGIIIPIFNDGIKETILKKLLKTKTHYEEISERLRILYVALTRAKEKMVVVSKPFSDRPCDNERTLDLSEKLSINSFYDCFNLIRGSIRDYIKLSLIEVTKDYENKTSIPLEFTEHEKVEFLDVSVKMHKEVKEVASTSYFKLYSKEELNNLELGIKLHKYLELIDLNQDITMQINKLDLDNKLKTKLKSFYELYILKEKIIKVYHEQHFSYEDSNILYKGVIDLILELSNKFVIIDFKLSNLEKKEYERQLSIYYNYLKKVTNKQVEAYLYSILNEELKRVI